MTTYIAGIEIKEIPSRALLTLKATCQYLGKSPDKIRQLADTGELKARAELDTAGRKHRVFCIEDLEEYIDNLPDWVESGRSRKEP